MWKVAATIHEPNKINGRYHVMEEVKEAAQERNKSKAMHQLHRQETALRPELV